MCRPQPHAPSSNTAPGYDDDIALNDEQVAEVERRMADPNRNFLSLSDTRQSATPLRRMRLVVDVSATTHRRVDRKGQPARSTSRIGGVMARKGGFFLERIAHPILTASWASAPGCYPLRG